MTLNKKQPYRFLPSDPAIFVEIYIPKKSNFQGTLYDTLTLGFDIEEVKSHFKDKEKSEYIRELLTYYQALNEYTDEMINDFPALFFGYSMYEVDGVYYGEDKTIQEERTQVIRMMFRPNFDDILKEYPDDIKRNMVKTVSGFLRAAEGKEDYLKMNNLDPLKSGIVEAADKWKDYVGLFIFGYIIYNLCEKIVQLCLQEKLTWNEAEDEIWVTSWWNLTINRIELRLQPEFYPVRPQSHS